jgi:hypothetical protein
MLILFSGTKGALRYLHPKTETAINKFVKFVLHGVTREVSKSSLKFSKLIFGLFVNFNKQFIKYIEWSICALK